MSEDADLYDRDFFAWTEAQAERLRAAARVRPDSAIDWENVAEEIESLGKRDRRELDHRVTNVIEHLLRLRSPEVGVPVAEWRATIIRERQEIETILEQSPSLRQHVHDRLAEAHDNARKLVEIELTASEISQMSWRSFSVDEVLGCWRPERDGSGVAE